MLLHISVHSVKCRCVLPLFHCLWISNSTSDVFVRLFLIPFCFRTLHKRSMLIVVSAWNIWVFTYLYTQIWELKPVKACQTEWRSVSQSWLNLNIRDPVDVSTSRFRAPWAQSTAIRSATAHMNRGRYYCVWSLVRLRFITPGMVGERLQ
jgi:hypothetical protein